MTYLQKRNFLSFDVEDAYQSFKERGLVGWRSDPYGERARLSTIHQILDNSQVKGTFFVLTSTLSVYRKQILELSNSGHEIASHGHEHIKIDNRSKKSFTQDIKKSKELLEDLLGRKIQGYRAPGFSVTASNAVFVYEEMEKLGYLYSSSTSGKIPIVPKSSIIREFPATSVGIYGKRIRLCGGFTFRVIPWILTRQIARSLNYIGYDVNFYLHPYEFTSEKYFLSEDPYVNFIRYARASSTLEKFCQLIQEFRFKTFSEELGLDV